ncbi:MAG: hypothetical protein WD877_01040 [Candidatus Saccharimonadales bacterium]
MKLPVSIKHLQTSQTNSVILSVVAIATVVTVFCLVSAKTLVSQAAYQNRLLSAKNQTVKQLETDKTSAQTLTSSYKAVFASNEPLNVLGAKNDFGANAIPPDIDNTRLTLNALPVTYDFPALISSLSKILNASGISSPSISATDESETASNQPAADPKPIEIKFSISGNGNYDSIKRLIRDFERSIRPFDIVSLQLSGSDSFMTVGLNAVTYYQPAKTLDSGKKEIR